MWLLHLPVAGAGVALIVNGANLQQMNGTTNSAGQVSFSYTGLNPGNDTVQAVTSIGGMGTFSNVVNATWTGTIGGSAPGGATPGWIGSPLPYTVVTAPVVVRLGNVQLAAGTVDLYPAAYPANVRVLAAKSGGRYAGTDVDGHVLRGCASTPTH